MFFSIKYLSETFKSRDVHIYEYIDDYTNGHQYVLVKNNHTISFYIVEDNTILFRELVFNAYYKLILKEFVNNEFMTLPLDEEHGNGD